MNLAEFTTRLWTEYPRDLCHNRPGTKPNLEKAAKKIKVIEYKQILLDMDALKRYDRQEVKPDRWPHASRFLNGRYWERIVESVMHRKEKKAPEKCKCGNPVDIGPTGECVECYAKRTDQNQHKRKSVLESINLYSPGQSRSEVIANCKEMMSPSVKSGEAFKSREIPYLKNLSKPLTEPEKDSTPSNSEVIYGEEWFKENAERIYGSIGMKFDV